MSPTFLNRSSASHQGTERHLGELEAEIMRVMWARGEGTVRDVRDALNASRQRPFAYTTIMTVMSRLAEKGLLRRRLVGKVHQYQVAQTEEQFLHAASRRLIRSLIDDFGEVAIAEFLIELEHVGPERRRRLKRLAARAQQLSE